MSNRLSSNNDSAKHLTSEDLGLDNFDGTEKTGWLQNHKISIGTALSDDLIKGPSNISIINSEILQRVESGLSPKTRILTSTSYGDDFFDWIDGNKKPQPEIQKKGVVFENFFDDEDEFIGPMQPIIPEENKNPQARCEEITIAKSHDDLERIMNELSGYKQTSPAIGSNADITNPEHIAHMSDTLPFIFDKLGDVSLCLKEEGVSNIYDKDDGSQATLGFIENPDHFDIINPLTGNSEYTVSNIRHDGHYAVTSVSIFDGLINVIFNIEINNSNKLSCIATNLGGQALAVYAKNNQTSTEQNIACNDLVKGKSKDAVFESFIFLLNSGYYTSNLDKIFTPKKACNK